MQIKTDMNVQSLIIKNVFFRFIKPQPITICDRSKFQKRQLTIQLALKKIEKERHFQITIKRKEIEKILLS